MKPYQKIPIQDCGEPLCPIPLEQFALESPHPYEKLGAPYHLSGTPSPYYLRQGVLERLVIAQDYLQQNYPSWKIKIFDAYRPIEVQQFMVNHATLELLTSQGFPPDLNLLSEPDRESILAQVYQFWAIPSADPATPPPHSTGAALDITLVRDHQETLDMGSPIDEISPRSHPDHFATVTTPTAQQYHQNRQILKQIMIAAGFQQHPQEWWHFSYGDQMWVWLTQDDQTAKIAKYGRVIPSATSASA